MIAATPPTSRNPHPIRSYCPRDRCVRAAAELTAQVMSLSYTGVHRFSEAPPRLTGATTSAPDNEEKRTMPYTHTVDTPDGPLSIIATDQAVLASGWTSSIESLRLLIHPTLRPPASTLHSVHAAEATGALAEAITAVTAYYAGDTDAVGAVPVLQHSGPYRRAAWEALRTIAPGEVLTYTEFAARTPNPAAIRAAASACAANAAALFIPCHRIIAKDGGLGGFRYGLTVKQSLLTREQRLP